MADRRSGERRSGGKSRFPTPPIKNMTDFVVFAFVTIVAVMLIGGILSFIILSFMDPTRDMSRGVGIFSDITTTLISALVGFMAGKGQGAAEAQEREIQRKHDVGQPPEKLEDP